MVPTTYEQVPDPPRFWARMVGLIAASYLIDSALLTLFVVVGVIGAWVPLAYAAAGMLSCGAFYLLVASGVSARFPDSSLALPQLVSATTVQLIFMVLAPAAAVYFVTVLFIIFSFGSLRLKPREALIAWSVVALVLAAILVRSPQGLVVPQQTPAIRALVCLSILLVLARCLMLGLYSSRLRIIVGERYSRVRESLAAHERHDAAVAQVLHEDLGQELTGISMILAACGSRLRGENELAAREVAAVAEHLQAAIGKTRRLANSMRGDARRPGPSRRAG